MKTMTSEKDLENLTLTFVTEFDAPRERVWQVWEDPRLLERWWGPPTWPATFVRHDFVEGGRSSYYMTGPEGEEAHGWWLSTRVEAPERFEFDDGFADENGEPTGDLGATHAVVTLAGIEGGTRMTITSRFESADQLEQMVAMGMEEGMGQALGQIDALLAE